MEVSGLPSFMVAAGSRDHCLWSGAGTSNCHVICHSATCTWQLYLTESIICNRPNSVSQAIVLYIHVHLSIWYVSCTYANGTETSMTYIEAYVYIMGIYQSNRTRPKPK